MIPNIKKWMTEEETKALLDRLDKEYWEPPTESNRDFVKRMSLKNPDFIEKTYKAWWLAGWLESEEEAEKLYSMGIDYFQDE